MIASREEVTELILAAKVCKGIKWKKGDRFSVSMSGKLLSYKTY